MTHFIRTSSQRPMGWIRELPDFRDRSPLHTEITPILCKSQRLSAARKDLPGQVDLRQWCSPIEDQGELGSCTAHAAVGMLEYFERRAFGKHLDASRTFVYKATRNLLGVTGDTGADIRTTMKALVLFGAPPERNWSYKISDYDKEPPAFVYALAKNWQGLQYYRLDPVGTGPDAALQNLREHLAGGLPAMFGFVVYSSIDSSAQNGGLIPFPTSGEARVGGHAVMAVGYDDTRKIGNSTGALLIRNSWSTSWGDQGYGWLPYDYVRQGLAVDFWSLTQSAFVDTDLFN